MDNWIYCDVCNEPISFQNAMTGLEKHNMATCHDCFKKLNFKENKAKELKQRLRIRRRERINKAYDSLRGSM